MATEIGREDDEDEGYQGSSEHVLHSPGSSESPPEMEDTFVRQMQLVRGSVSTKMVASKLTVRSLQIVKLEELSDADRCENFVDPWDRTEANIPRLCHLLQRVWHRGSRRDQGGPSPIAKMRSHFR